MSNPDSFIDEVTEEVRRDKLYAVLRKYGWIGVAGVILIVGGAAVNEWIKARDRADAEAAGDAILDAIAVGDPATRIAALEAIPAQGDRAALLGLIVAAETGDAASAAERLQAIADNTALPSLYRDLAVLKRAMLPGSPVAAADRKEALAPLTAAGAPFRALAEEQTALAEIELGETDAALTRLSALLADQDASGALRQRASQLIVALGGNPDGA